MCFQLHIPMFPQKLYATKRTLTFCEVCHLVSLQQMPSVHSQHHRVYQCLPVQAEVWQMLDSEEAAQSRTDKHLVPTFWSDAPERSLLHQHTKKTGEIVTLLHGQTFLTCRVSVPHLKPDRNCTCKVTMRWVWTFTSWFRHWVWTVLIKTILYICFENE